MVGSSLCLDTFESLRPCWIASGDAHGRACDRHVDRVVLPQAWRAYDRWQSDPRVEFVNEPAELEAQFRAFTRLRQSATKDWADSYLAAFATVGRLTLVTFDKGLRAKARSTVLLG